MTGTSGFTIVDGPPASVDHVEVDQAGDDYLLSAHIDVRTIRKIPDELVLSTVFPHRPDP